MIKQNDIALTKYETDQKLNNKLQAITFFCFLNSILNIYKTKNCYDTLPIFQLFQLFTSIKNDKFALNLLSLSNKYGEGSRV